jgi:hypothetical protein
LIIFKIQQLEDARAELAVVRRGSNLADDFRERRAKVSTVEERDTLHEDIGKAITCQEGGVASNAITAWHPDDESGYYAEYRADTGLNKAGGGLATVDGDEISQWDDVSGNARHMSHSTAGEYPKLDTTGDYPRVEFDINDFQQWNNAPAARPHVAFVVADPTTTVNTAVIFSTQDSSTRMRIAQGAANETVANSNSAARELLHNRRSIITAVTNATTNTIQVDAGPLEASTPAGRSPLA